MKSSARNVFTIPKTLKHFLFLPLLSILVMVTAFSIPPGKHVGTWKGEDSKEKIGSLVLDSSGYAMLLVDGETLGGKNFEMNGIGAECKYEIDYSKDPVWLDIAIYNKESHHEMSRLKGIIKFISNDKIMYRINFEGERYTRFDPNDKENTIILNRVSD
jgi:hypothetical protein